MLIAALRDKFRERGPLGFAVDAAKVSLAYGYIAAQAVFIGSGAAAVVAIASELIGRRGHRCGADCATDRASCRNAEENLPLGHPFECALVESGDCGIDKCWCDHPGCGLLRSAHEAPS